MRHLSTDNSLLEIAAGILVMMLLVALAADAFDLLCASSINDNACRDAVHAAAQTNNSAEAFLFAEHALSARKKRGALISAPTITSFDYHDYGGAPMPGQTPYVEISTEILVRLPAPLFFYGINGANGNLALTQTYAYPILKSKFVLPGHSWAACHPRLNAEMLLP